MAGPRAGCAGRARRAGGRGRRGCRRRQGNKTRTVAERFAWVHSVERLKIAERLSAQRPAGRGPLNVCLQVNVSGEASKSGCAPEEAAALAQAIARLPALRLRGLMAIPAPADDEMQQRLPFRELRRIYESLSEMLREERETDRDGELNLRLFNLSRVDGRTLDRVVDAVLRHQRWSTGCADCTMASGAGDGASACPIRLNRDLLLGDEVTPGDGNALFRRRLGELFEIASANGRHVPIRQVFALVANIVLGDAGNPDQPLLTCAEARARAWEGSYRLTNPYDNAVGINLRAERRQGNAMFGVLGAFGLGQETNNVVDDLLLHGRPEPVLRATEACDPTYGQRLFEMQRNAYVRGGPTAFAPEEFGSGIEAQRRRLFFRLPAEAPANGGEAARSASGLTPWSLTVFHHGGLYLRFRDALQLRSDANLVYRISRLLIRGMNRTLTGLMTDDSEQLWLAGAVGRTDDPTGRVAVNDAISLAGGGSLFHVAIEHDEQRGRPRLTVGSVFSIGRMSSLDLRPILFEYLVRVANGSLPSSFSRQCHQEIRRFAMMLSQDLTLLQQRLTGSGVGTRIGILHLNETGAIQRENIEVGQR